MGFFWIGWIELSEEEYKTQLAERKEKQRQTTTNVGQQQQQQQ